MHPTNQLTNQPSTYLPACLPACPPMHTHIHFPLRSPPSEKLALPTSPALDAPFVLPPTAPSATLERTCAPDLPLPVPLLPRLLLPISRLARLSYRPAPTQDARSAQPHANNTPHMPKHIHLPRAAVHHGRPGPPLLLSPFTSIFPPCLPRRRPSSFPAPPPPPCCAALPVAATPIVGSDSRSHPPSNSSPLFCRLANARRSVPSLHPTRSALHII